MSRRGRGRVLERKWKCALGEKACVKKKKCARKGAHAIKYEMKQMYEWMQSARRRDALVNV